MVHSFFSPAICLEFLNDPYNSAQAHQTACKAKEPSSTIALVNYAVFLYNNDREGANRDRIIELLMDFEKCWLKRKNSDQFDDNIMSTVSNLAVHLNLASHLSWMKAAVE